MSPRTVFVTRSSLAKSCPRINPYSSSASLNGTRVPERARFGLCWGRMPWQGFC
jgi:hypothetical protein